MLDDVWRLDLASERPTWQQLNPAGQKPGPRCSHTAVAVGSDIVFHGGAGESALGHQPLTGNSTHMWPLHRLLSINGYVGWSSMC